MGGRVGAGRGWVAAVLGVSCCCFCSVRCTALHSSAVHAQVAAALQVTALRFAVHPPVQVQGLQHQLALVNDCPLMGLPEAAEQLASRLKVDLAA